MVKPIYRHDCEKCCFLGSTLGGQRASDLYFCANVAGTTLIARYGNDGPDYLSTPAEIANPRGHAELFVAKTLWEKHT